MTNLGCGTGGSKLQPTCANTTNCHRKTRFFCPCHLVFFCSPECQKAHWKHHVKDHKNPHAKDSWVPSFAARIDAIEPAKHAPLPVPEKLHFLFGNTPDVDLFQLAKNEGATYDKDISMLFAGSGDLRNVMRTVVSIPEGFKPKFEVVVNDNDHAVVLRNLVMLLLAFEFPGGEASEVIFHLWYSASLPKRFVDIIEEKVTARIRSVCIENNTKRNEEFVTQIWSFGDSSLRFTMRIWEWCLMRKILEKDLGFEYEDSEPTRKAVMLPTPADQNKFDILERGLFWREPYHRVTDLRFLETGVVLPFQASCEDFKYPNPTFFNAARTWLMQTYDHHWILTGSSIPSLLSTIKNLDLPQNDNMGAFFYARRELIESFCRRLSTHSIHIDMYNVPAEDLHTTLSTPNPKRFDRIDTSNLLDSSYLGVEKLMKAMSLLLKESEENPHATLITSLQSEIIELANDPRVVIPSASLRDFLAKLPKDLTSGVKEWATNPLLEIIIQNQFSDMALTLVADYENDVQGVLKYGGFEEVAAKWGVKLKKNNSVVGKWEWGIEEGVREEAGEELKGELKRRMDAHGYVFVRFLEWRWERAMVV